MQFGKDFNKRNIHVQNSRNFTTFPIEGVSNAATKKF